MDRDIIKFPLSKHDSYAQNSSKMAKRAVSNGKWKKMFVVCA
jgi:hypothetical protein